MAESLPEYRATDVATRPADTVMRLARMGAFHQSRLSFKRVLLRRLKQNQWQFDRPRWDIDAAGVGVATYRARGPERTYTLVAFAHDLPADQRSDRVIATAWDATFTLFDGEPTEQDMQRLAEHVPLQEAGRLSESELVLARANRSVRLFELVTAELAAGNQPEPESIESTGYLMRTTAVYGSGKFGAADRDKWKSRSEFTGSFQPELLTVWLIRAFTLDLVEHIARSRAPTTAVTLDPDLRRRIGVGNSTGLGMAPFLVNHPSLLHAWIHARESALARVRSQITTSDATRARFTALLDRAATNADDWRSGNSQQSAKIEGLRADLVKLKKVTQQTRADSFQPWNSLYQWAEDQLGLEAQEQLVSLLIDCHAELIDDLATTMSADEQANFRIDGSMSVAQLRTAVESCYHWALKLDFSDPECVARVWYVSAEKLEPRLGERHEEPLGPYEQPLAPARDAVSLHRCLRSRAPAEPIAELLLAHPEHRHTVRRVQRVSALQYAEIYDNTIASTLLPIDLLRCKLAFFGATKFDPRSDRWVRITLFQGAPLPAELAYMDPDDMAYPPLQP